MSKLSKTDIYEDKIFFGDYLESTSEKDFFINEFVKRVSGTQVNSLLDLGCFNGSLTRKLISRLEQAGQRLANITVLEPASHACLNQHLRSLSQCPANA